MTKMKKENVASVDEPKVVVAAGGGFKRQFHNPRGYARMKATARKEMKEEEFDRYPPPAPLILLVWVMLVIMDFLMKIPPALAALTIQQYVMDMWLLLGRRRRRKRILPLIHLTGTPPCLSDTHDDGFPPDRNSTSPSQSLLSTVCYGYATPGRKETEEEVDSHDRHSSLFG